MMGDSIDAAASMNYYRPTSVTPVGVIGWSQDSVNPQVYNVSVSDMVSIRNAVNEALTDQRGVFAYMREHFPDEIRVFNRQGRIISIDNRRLVIWRLVVSPDTPIPVREITEVEAGQEILRNPDANRVMAALALHGRMTTTDGGYSILIRETPEVRVDPNRFERRGMMLQWSKMMRNKDGLSGGLSNGRNESEGKKGGIRIWGLWIESNRDQHPGLTEEHVLKKSGPLNLKGNGSLKVFAAPGYVSHYSKSQRTRSIELTVPWGEDDLAYTEE
ncbi:uncharacterized protein EDB93DRAFT_1108285 [Suillus bovinus]|uniref:uncharacterized protein n=1 Tax=Suillus bovinus TaxID=48563 RepID=UPI001B86F0B7|nr:uncharacterized protein EDB93DRAFT_1108285 [Suillus bovinus]KAG2130762.1 hypothetical protein EDB93DRAFT_1108285 [Suillus bovinus]